MFTHIRHFAVASVLAAITPMVHAQSCSECTRDCNNSEQAMACIGEADETAGYAACGAFIIACMARCQSNCSSAEQDAADTSAALATVQRLQTDSSDVSNYAGQAVQNIQQQGSRVSADDAAALAAFQNLQQAASSFAVAPALGNTSADELDQEEEDQRAVAQQAFQQAIDQTGALMSQQARQTPLKVPTRAPQLQKAPSASRPSYCSTVIDCTSACPCASEK